MPLLGVMCGAHFASGATLQVDAKLGMPWSDRRFHAALDAAQPGDTVRVAPGVYHEHLSFKTGGTAEQPIVLEGQEGAILDGSAEAKLDWQLDESIAPGVYRAAVDFFPYTITRRWQDDHDSRREEDIGSRNRAYQAGQSAGPPFSKKGGAG